MYNALYCSKSCKRVKKSQQRREHPNYRANTRRYNLSQKFGISLEQYDEMLRRQNHCCAICHRHQDEIKRKFAVDHDHATGRIRSLLCNFCNTSLGGFDDSIEKLERAISYLEHHRAEGKA